MCDAGGLAFCAKMADEPEVERESKCLHVVELGDESGRPVCVRTRQSPAQEEQWPTYSQMEFDQGSFGAGGEGAGAPVTTNTSIVHLERSAR